MVNIANTLKKSLQLRNSQYFLLLDFIKEYISLSNRHSSSRIKVVEAFHEPNEFIKYFHGKISSQDNSGWNRNRNPPLKTTLESIYANLTLKTYPKQILLSGNIPAGVDLKRIEYYLSLEEFKELFGVEREVYEEMKGWKREEMKKRVGFM